MASNESPDPTDIASQPGTPLEAGTPSTQSAGGKADRQFRLKLAIFWGVILAAIAAAFATGYPGWENYIAQEAAKRQLRAYIDVRPKGMTTIEEGLVPRVRDSFHNIGRTPAYDDGAFSRITVAEYPLKTKLISDDCSHISPPPKTSKWFIGKVSRPEIARDAPFTAEEVEAIRSGKAAVYFHGRVCYRDIFNETHRTDFCLYWKWVAGGVSPGLYCDQGNSIG